jgi:hypothetical protein
MFISSISRWRSGLIAAVRIISKEVYLLFQAAILNIPANGFTGQDLRDLFGFGQEF